MFFQSPAFTVKIKEKKGKKHLTPKSKVNFIVSYKKLHSGYFKRTLINSTFSFKSIHNLYFLPKENINLDLQLL